MGVVAVGNVRRQPFADFAAGKVKKRPVGRKDAVIVSEACFARVGKLTQAPGGFSVFQSVRAGQRGKRAAGPSAKKRHRAGVDSLDRTASVAVVE